MTTYYELLGVEPTADHAVIKTAFRKALKEHHPDLNSGDAASERRSRRLIQAYNVLKNPKLRDRYNLAIQRGRTQHRRMLVIIVLVSAGITVTGGLLLHNQFSPAKHEVATGEPPVFQQEPPAANAAGPAPDMRAASEPGTQQPTPHQLAWQALETTGSMAELWTYAKTHPRTSEATLAEIRLWRLIDVSDDRAALVALRKEAVGRIAERVRRRLETLTGENTAVADSLPKSSEEEALGVNSDSPISEAPPQAAPGDLNQTVSESAPVLPR